MPGHAYAALVLQRALEGSSQQQALTSMAMRGGASTYWRTEQAEALSAELDRAAHAQDCWFELETTPQAFAAVRVTLDGIALVKDSPGGYVLHERRLTLQGQACERITDGLQHALTVQQSCASQL